MARRKSREAVNALSEIISKVFDEVIRKREEVKDEQFSGIRKVSDNHYESGVRVPDDGTAREIPIPDGFEVFISEEGKPMIRRKIEGECEEVVKDEPLTYDKIAHDFYGNKEAPTDPTNCLSKEQARRVRAFNKLQNIAIYLNDGWKPDLKDDSPKWFVNSENGEYHVYYDLHSMGCGCLFKTEELAKEAIRIMGRESLRDLYNNDWY